MDDLATRLAAHPRYRWMPGMLATVDGFPPLRLAEEVMLYIWRGWPVPEGGAAAVLQGDVVPDLADPATAGCLRAQLHEAAPDVDMDWWAHRSEWQAWPPALDAQLPIAADPICGRCIAAALLAVWGPA